MKLKECIGIHAPERRVNMWLSGSSRSAWANNRRAAVMSVGVLRRVGLEEGMTRPEKTPVKGGSYRYLGSTCMYMLY